MRLIDADAHKQYVLSAMMEDDAWTREDIAGELDAAPTVCCAECRHKDLQLRALVVDPDSSLARAIRGELRAKFGRREP